MSEQNEAIVRAVVEGAKQPEVIRQFANGEMDLGWVDPDIEWDASRLSELIPDLAEVYCGHEGVKTYWRRWFEAWSDLEFEIEGIRSAGDEVVVLIRDQHQWGRHSGIKTELPPYAQVFTLRDGVLMRWRTFPTQEAALEAVGLR